MNPLQPSIGQWYFNKDLGRRFEVVGIDEKAGTIELQDEEGFLDEMDNDTWLTAQIEFTAQPIDLTEVFDSLTEQDEAGGDAAANHVIAPASLDIAGSELPGQSVSEEEDP